MNEKVSRKEIIVMSNKNGQEKYFGVETLEDGNEITVWTSNINDENIIPFFSELTAKSYMESVGLSEDEYELCEAVYTYDIDTGDGFCEKVTTITNF